MSKAQFEIYNQYEAAVKTKELVIKKKELICNLLENINNYVFLGCGSSYYLAKSGAAIASVYGADVSVALAAGDLIVNKSVYKKMIEKSCIIMISRSGMTSEMVLAAEYIKTINPKAVIISICSVNEAPLSKFSDLDLEIPWAFDESVCQTRTVTNLYLALAIMLALRFNDQKTLDDFDRLIENGNNYLRKVTDMVSSIIDREWKNAVVLADAETCGIAEEGALAFNEICQRRSNYYHVLDFRHGPMVLLDKDTLVVVLLSSEETDRQNALLKDLKNRGAFVVCVSSENHSEDSDILVQIKDYTHIVKGVALLNVLQIITLGIANTHGINPDEPTGLDAWIKL